MAKAHRKAHGTHRETRKEKRAQQRRQFIRAHKLQIALCALGAAVLLAGLALAIDYFYNPGGGMKVFMGKVMDAGEQDLITNLNEGGAPVYYNLGSYQPPEGYVRSGSLNQTEDPRVHRFQYRAEDESSLIQRINVQGAAGASAKERTEFAHLQALRMYGNSSGVMEGTVNGLPVYYLYTVTPNPIVDEEKQAYPDENRAALSMLFDTPMDGVVHVELVSQVLPKDQLPDQAALFALAPECLKGLKIAE